MADRGLCIVLPGRRGLFGVATDYCVLNTVKDALSLGYEVRLITDGICAVNVHTSDGPDAEAEVIGLGARPV